MKNGATTHPKIMDLAEMVMGRLKERGADLLYCTSQALAAGMCERLWHYASQYVQAGDIGKLSRGRIADAIGWAPDDADWIVEALKKVRLLDQPGDHSTLRIHDWYDHAQDSVHLYLWRERKRFADGRPPKLYPLPEKERPLAAEFYGIEYGPKRGRAQAQGEQDSQPSVPSEQPRGDEPRSEHASEGAGDSDQGGNANLPKADPEPRLGRNGFLPRQSPENVPRLASPRHASPPPAVADRPVEHPGGPPPPDARGPEPGGGGGPSAPRGEDPETAERERAYRALVAVPWPRMSPRKARGLVDAHPPGIVLAAVREAREANDRGEKPPIGAGLIADWIVSGDTAARQVERDKVAARQLARDWWNRGASPEDQARALESFRSKHPDSARLPEASIVGSAQFLEFIATAVQRMRAARRSA